eukprot:s1661_g6.t2
MLRHALPRRPWVRIAAAALLWRGLASAFCGRPSRGLGAWPPWPCAGASRTTLPQSRFQPLRVITSGFQDLPLSEEAQVAIKNLGYTSLTDVQQQTFRPISEGKDLVVRAKTGAGKTLSFLLPSMDRLHNSKKAGIQILVLSPVRELSMQIHREASKLAQRFPTVEPILMVGGSNWEEDMKTLDAANGGVILIATPGRLQTHLAKTPAFANRLAEVQTLILDEVDQLCGELFAEATACILDAVPSASQFLFYSATLTEEVTQLINQVSKSHDLVDVEGEESTVPEGIVQTYKVVSTDEMSGALWQSVRVARDYLSPPKIVVIFITGRIAAYYAEVFRQASDLDVFEIHSRMKQQQRSSQSDAFRHAASGMLFTSDITSRGLDYPGVTAVIQLGAPESRYDYVHRVGRTGRADSEGLGILLLHDFEADWLENLEGLPLTEAELDTAESSDMCFEELAMPENVKAQAYYSRINHAMRHPEDLDVLEVFRDAFRFAKSIGALDAASKPPALTEANAQRYGVAEISDPAVHIVKASEKPKVTISYEIMSAAEVHHATGFLLEKTCKDHSKVVIHFVSGDLAKYYAELFRSKFEVFESHSAVSKKVRKKILQSFESAERGVLFTAGLSPATLPCKGVTAVILAGLPSSAKDAKQLLDFVTRSGKALAGPVTTYLLAATFEAEILRGLLADAQLVPAELKGDSDRPMLEEASLHEKLVSKAYFTWLRHYGLHPLSQKRLLVASAGDFAVALGALDAQGQVPQLTRQMAEDMGALAVEIEP